jgi:hypothetical protein
MNFPQGSLVFGFRRTEVKLLPFPPCQQPLRPLLLVSQSHMGVIA